MSIRNNIESGFAAFGLWVFNNRIKTLLFVLVVIAALFSNLPKLTIDTSSEGFLHEDDPILQQYNNFRAQFGRDEMVMLAIKTDNVFTQETLRKLKALHDELEAGTPYLDEVTSLVNVRNTRGEGNRLIVEDLLENWPETEEELAAVKKLAMESSLYRNFLLSEDGRFTTIMIRTSAFADSGETSEEDLLAGFEDAGETSIEPTEVEYLTDAQNSEMVRAVQSIVDKYRSDEFPIYIAGPPAVVDEIKRAMQHDMQTFTKFALLAIALVLLVLFRRISGVVMPLLVVILTLVSTFAAMAATGTAIKLPTQILPSFLLAVGIAAAVHLLAIFYRFYDKEGDKGAAISHALGHSGLAIVMTSLTTAAGLLSFSASEVAPIADLGRFAAAGVLISLLYTLLLTPALIALFPIRKKSAEKGGHGGFMDKLLSGFAHVSVRHAKGIVVAAAAIFVVALGGVLQSTFHHDPLRWMPETWEIRQATDLLDNHMRGTSTTEVVIQTGQENGLYDPKLIHSMEQFDAAANDMVVEEMFIGKTSSVIDILKESNRALNENRQEFYRVPDDRELIAQELLLFENSGSDDLEDFVDSQFSQARITMKGPWVDAGSHAHLIEKVDQTLAEYIGDEADYYITGMGSLFSRTMNAAIHSTTESYLIASMVISIMMILLLGSLKLGITSMAPNFLPIFVAIGAMGYMGIPFDMFTLLIGSIAIGLVVDDTIHFMHNFRRYFQQSGDVEQAVEATLLSTGRAIMVTTVVLCIGFFMFTAATMSNVVNFGILTGSTILMALLADLLLAPALMTLIYGRKKQGVSHA